jgi:phage terminase large subunit
MPIKQTTALRKIAQLNKRYIAIRGGQGSAKTISILILLINHASSKPNRDIYIVSAELTKMRDTVIKDFVNIMREANLFNEDRFLAGREYRYPNGSNIKFIGLDKEDVGKGLRSHVVYFNEVNKVNQESFRQMASRSDKIYLDYNPDAEFYVDTDILTRPDCAFIQLTFKDNEMLKEGERDEILNYQTQGYNLDGTIKNKYWANLWQVYGLGNIGNLIGVIFENWNEVKEIPKDAEFIAYGMDFGFSSDPTTLTACYRYNGELYFNELLYKTKLTNSDIVKEFESLGIGKHQMIVADSAEPKSIEDIRRAGYRIEGAKKGADSIKNGLDTLLRHSINVTENSTNLKNELRNYRWASDKDGKQINVPEGGNDHAIDGIRYVALNRLKKSTFIIQ